MKKTLIAASIAALAATSANAAVKIYESETGSLSSYGKIQLELENYDGENTIQNQSSRLGFAGEQELKHGLTGFANVEFRFNPGVQNNVGKANVSGEFNGVLDVTGSNATGSLDGDLAGDGGEWTVRNSYLGVKGDFGSIKAGNFDSITHTMVTEQADIMENLGYRSLDDGSTNARGTAIAYETNDISGFKFGLGIKHYASNKSQYAGAGAPLESADGKEQWNLAVAATYQLNDELSFGLAVDQNNKKGNPANSYTKGTGKDADPIIAAKVNYETEQFGAGLVVEQTKDIIVTNLTGSYNYGAGDVYALVSFVDLGKKANEFGTPDKNGVDFGLGVNYKLADNFKVYGEVAVGNDDVSDIKKLDTSGDGTTAVTLGAAYKW